MPQLFSLVILQNHQGWRGEVKSGSLMEVRKQGWGRVGGKQSVEIETGGCGGFGMETSVGTGRTNATQRRYFLMGRDGEDGPVVFPLCSSIHVQLSLKK